MKFVVIGGTGLIGSKVVACVREEDEEAVAASPNSSCLHVAPAWSPVAARFALACSSLALPRSANPSTPPASSISWAVRSCSRASARRRGGRDRCSPLTSQREAPAEASANARPSSTTATAKSGTERANCARTSWPTFAARIALDAPMAAAGGHGACRVRAESPAASPPRTSRLVMPTGASLLGVAGSLSTTSSTAAPAIRTRLVHA
jgi:hypothetical protein